MTELSVVVFGLFISELPVATYVCCVVGWLGKHRAIVWDRILCRNLGETIMYFSWWTWSMK